MTGAKGSLVDEAGMPIDGATIAIVVRPSPGTDFPTFVVRHGPQQGGRYSLRTVMPRTVAVSAVLRIEKDGYVTVEHNLLLHKVVKKDFVLARVREEKRDVGLVEDPPAPSL